MGPSCSLLDSLLHSVVKTCLQNNAINHLYEVNIAEKQNFCVCCCRVYQEGDGWTSREQEISSLNTWSSRQPDAIPCLTSVFCLQCTVHIVSPCKFFEVIHDVCMIHNACASCVGVHYISRNLR